MNEFEGGSFILYFVAHTNHFEIFSNSFNSIVEKEEGTEGNEIEWAIIENILIKAARELLDKIIGK